jgi:hypothetical protein
MKLVIEKQAQRNKSPGEPSVTAKRLALYLEVGRTVAKGCHIPEDRHNNVTVATKAADKIYHLPVI